MVSSLLLRFGVLAWFLVLTGCEGGGDVQAQEVRGVDRDNSLPSSVWLVEKGGKKLYLGGTIHLLRKEDHPLPEVFERAYADCGRVVFELPPEGDGDETAVRRMRELGMYLTEEGVDKHVSSATMRELNEWLKRRGFGFESFRMMRPWLIALTIASTEYQLIGAQPNFGVDKYFEERARKDSKPTAGLESVEFQLSIFAELSAELQEKLLLQTLAEVEAIGEDFAEMLSAWRKGDADTLQQFLFRDADKYPDLMEAFLTKRNRNWVKPVLGYLEGERTTFVLVGAGHIGGEDGLIDLLKKEGCVVTQMR